jgi:hypothetical protein
MGKFNFCVRASACLWVLNIFSLTAYAQNLPEPNRVGAWKTVNQAVQLQAIQSSAVEDTMGHPRIQVPVKTKLNIIAERPSPEFPDAPFAAQATSTSVQGTDIVISFATMGEMTGGGIEWVKWENGQPVVIGQFFHADVDIFSVTQVSNAIVGVGQVRDRGAAVFVFRKVQSGLGKIVAIKYLEDFSGVEVQTEFEGPQGGIVRVLTGSTGAAHWFSISPTAPLESLGSNLDLVNPMGSVSFKKQFSYVLEGNGPQQLSLLDRAGFSRQVVGQMNLGSVGAPAALFVENQSVMTNAGIDQIRTYRMNNRRQGGGLELRHFQELPGLGNDMEIKGPFVTMAQGQAGLLVGFMSRMLEPLSIQQAITNPPMSANKTTMVRVGKQNLIFLSGGRNGLKVLEQQTAIVSKDENRYTLHGPARFWLADEISEFKNLREIELYFDKQDGTQIRCKYRDGKFCVCNWPVPKFIDFKSVYVDWLRTHDAPAKVEIPIGFAI